MNRTPARKPRGHGHPAFESRAPAGGPAAERAQPRTRRSLKALKRLLLAGLLCAAGACGGDQTRPQPSAPPAVAEVATPGAVFEVRDPGSTDFAPGRERRSLRAGATIRTGESLVALNVIRSVQVQVAPQSELIVVGLRDGSPSAPLVLALQAGEIRVNAAPSGRDLIVETPAGEVSGPAPHFTAHLDADEDGLYHLRVQAFSRGISLTNDLGSLTLSNLARACASELAPPALLP